MGFDQGSELPIVNLHKKTTQVNASIITGVVLFLLATALVALLLWRNPEETVNRMHEKASATAPAAPK